jgi:hypothetical protein
MVVFFAGMGMSQIASTTTPGKKDAKAAVNAQGKIIDTNKNGICDNFEAKKAGAPGKNFTDKNGDGKCDNQGKGGKGNGICCGSGNGNGNCCGKGQQGNGGCGNGHQHRNGGCSTAPASTTQPTK